MTYLLRFLVVFAVLMWFIHNLFFPTIANNSKNRHILDKFGPYELIIASYFILKWIWLKFTVIWRFFRIWALLDGIESPENMGRCMSNNYCFEGFWRMWHRAFNQWLIRYLFIPLGGGKYKIFNIWVVFGFVALWHDLTLNLLAWGWGMCIFIMPEVLAKAYFASERMAGFRKTLVYSWMSACAGGVYICLMILANLVGFSFGLAGLRITLEGMMNFEGFLLLLKSLTVLTFGTHFMLLFREDEQRRGLKDKGY
jgi:D-alanyl-lipoteichoic acid acyltransferase DltB (MBOAT superfamily)